MGKYFNDAQKILKLNRLLRVMKISFILTTFYLSCVSAISYSQNAKLNLKMEDSALKDVIHAIEQNSEFIFFYNDKTVDVNRKVSISVNDATLTDILDKVLGSNVSYQIIDRQVILYQKNSDISSNTGQAAQPQRKVSGTVKDVRGETIIGATIVEVGTTNGTTTNADGYFEIAMLAKTGGELKVSYVGFKQQVIQVGAQTRFDLVLEESVSELDEVIVVGFGTQKKMNLTGAVGVVDAKVLKDRPVQNVSQALQGLMPGLNISQSNGSLNDRASINIRGAGTIGQGSTAQPLILIDGMDGDINMLNPQDIENISVLKDASASSIYGSRAAFGVILITTKKGAAGRTNVNYSVNLRNASPILLPEMMDSYTFATFFNDASRNTGTNPHFSAEHLQRIKDYQDGKITNTIIPDPNNPKDWSNGFAYGNDNIDWYKKYFKSSSFSNEHNLSVNGGNEKYTYYLSGNYLGQNGLLKISEDNFARYAFTARISAKITNSISLNQTTRFIREDSDKPVALTNTFYADVARQGWPTLPYKDPNGYVHPSSNALNLRDGGRDKSQKDVLYEQFQIVFEPIKGWKTFGELNYRMRTDFRHWDQLAFYGHNVDGEPYLRSTWPTKVYEDAYKTDFFSPSIYSEYSFSLKEKHNIKVMLGFQSELNKTRGLKAERVGILVPESPTINTTNGQDNLGNILPPAVGGDYQHWATAGFFGRLNYDYQGKYLLETNLRYDGTSRYRSDKRWNWFPSFSLGWNIAREEFWGSLTNTINTLKIRGSYGKLGNQSTSSLYPTYQTMPVGTANGTWLINGNKPNTADAPGLISTSLTWEKVESYGIGLDYGLLNNRLTGSVDFYERKTMDMVGPAPELPVTLGTTVPQINNTDLKTYGFEVEIHWRDQLRNGLAYNASFLLSDSRTKITRYPNETGSFSASYREGQMLGEIWGYKTKGIAKSTEEMQAHLAKVDQSSLGSNWGAGDIMYEDVNGDGKINSGSNRESDRGDKVLLGNNATRFNFGIDLGANWKGFDLRVFFQGVAKRDYWQGNQFFFGTTNSLWQSTGFKSHQDYFRDDPNHHLGINLDSYYPRPLFNGRNQTAQSRYILNASYIRLKNLQIGYTLPTTVMNKIGMNSLRVYVSGENLWTATKMVKMFDPETVGGGSGGSVYPLSKTFSLGLNLNF